MPALPIRLLPDRAEIQRRTRTATGQGGHTEAFAAVATLVPCRRTVAGADEIEAAARLETRITHALYFLADQDVRRDDRAMIGTISYDVRDVTQPSLPAYVKALVEEVQVGT